MRYTASLGSISLGRRDEEGLLDAFGSELSWLTRGVHGAQKHRNLAANALAQAKIEEKWRKRESWPDLLEDLMNALDEYAPSYCYFGTPPDDPSDYGYWPDMTQLNELPRIASWTEKGKPLDADGNRIEGDCVEVNDHGNMMLFSGNGKYIFGIV